MKKPALWFIIGVCTAGFVAGSLGRKLTRHSETPPPTVAETPAKTPAQPAIENARPLRSAAPVVKAHSTETIESLLGDLKSPDLYARLALWLVDASEDDIAQYWEGYRQHMGEVDDCCELIFLNWSRLNPEAVRAKFAGTQYEYLSWWAWGSNDPATALAASIADNKRRIYSVVMGIGAFHPAWLHAHMDEIPESERDLAISQMERWHGQSDPKEALDFAIQSKGRFNANIFHSLIEDDPEAAYEWALKNGKTLGAYPGDRRNPAMQQLIDELAASQPEILQRHAQQAPPGADKRKMEKLVFDQLVKDDPQTAMAQAAETKSPRTGAERYTSLGLAAVKSDPEQAFAMMQKVFTVYPDALYGSINVTIGNGGGGSGNPVAGAQDLLTELLKVDPSRVIEMQPTSTNPMTGRSSLYATEEAWARTDLPGMEEWTRQQQDPTLKNQFSSVILNQLQSMENYPAALEWAGGLEQNRSQSLVNILGNWANQAPDAASAWAAANLSDQDRSAFEKNYQLNHQR